MYYNIKIFHYNDNYCNGNCHLYNAKDIRKTKPIKLIIFHQKDDIGECYNIQYVRRDFILTSDIQRGLEKL